MQAANGSGKRGLGAGGEPSGSQRTCARSYWQRNLTKPKPGRHGARGTSWSYKCPAANACPLSSNLRGPPPRQSGRGRWFGGVRPSFSGSVRETMWSSPARNAGRGARRPPPSRALCSDAFRGSKSDLRPLRLPGNVSGQAPPIERAKLDAQQSGIAIEGRRASWRRREPRSRHC